MLKNDWSYFELWETKTILANILKHSLTGSKTQHELLKLYDVITRQNYFTSNQDIVIQHDGLAMGTPLTGIIAEIFLQHTEHAHLTYLTHKHSITNYFRYVDDSLLIFDPNHTDIQAFLKDFNALHPNLQSTTEVETSL